MEVGVRLVGLLLRFLNVVLAPLFWLRARDRRLPAPPAPLLLRSAVDCAAAIRVGELTSEELVSAYIERVKEVNPLLNAVVDERFRAALEEAKEVDRDIAEAKRNGRLEQLFDGRPLLGIPFTVKESCSLAGLSDAVGCLEYAGRKATKDGAAVRLMKEAGAIPLLVSNTPELCLGWETTNLITGTTNNPYCLARTAGGSSGGEAALLGAGASCASVSSDIAGSIRLPAAFCGIFGHKPTPGVSPVAGHVPSLESPLFARLLSVGPMARSADDLSLLLRVMTKDHRDPPLRLEEPVDITKIKVFVMTQATKSPALPTVDRDIQDGILDAARYLQDHCGATVCHEYFEEFEESIEMAVSVFFSMEDIPNMLRDPANPKRDKSLLLELVKSVFGGSSRSLQALGFALIHRHKLLISGDQQKYYQRRADKLREKIAQTLGDNGVLLWPVWSSAAHEHGRAALTAGAALYAAAWSILQCAAAVAPVGRQEGGDGMPRGVQIIAAPYQDRLCLAVAKRLEEGFGGWRPPAH